MKKGLHFYRIHAVHRGAKRHQRHVRSESHKRLLRRRLAEGGKKAQEIKKAQDYEKNHFFDYVHITAPEFFSFVENEKETLKFINTIRSNYSKRRKVYINLRNVKYVTTDALLLLLSNMYRFRTKKMDFNGNFPKDPKVRKQVNDSGFFKKLYDTLPRSQSYDIVGNSTFHTHANTVGDPVLSDKIIKRLSREIWGEEKRCLGVQRIILELMQNTNNHAGELKGEQHWWMSSSYDIEKNEATISFIDFGKGIFRSLDNKKPGEKFYGWRNRFFKLFPWADTDDKRFKEILQGGLYNNVPTTSTKLYYRGKGLPGIYKAHSSNALSSLFVISNHVFADIDNNHYYLLDDEFLGTFVSWKININSVNIK